MPTTTNIGGYDVLELHAGSGEGEIDYQGKGSAQRVFLIDWADRGGFYLANFGSANIVDGDIVDEPPIAHPDKPDLLPAKFNWKPSGKPTGTNTWEKAVVTITYETRAIDGQTEARYAEEVRATYEMIEVPHFFVSGDGNTYPQASTWIKIPCHEYHLTLFRLPEMPLQRALSFVGEDQYPPCNSATFKGAGPGHVVYLGCDARRESSSEFNDNLSPLNAQPIWQATYHFLITPISVLKKYDNATGDFVDLKHRLSDHTFYTPKDFNQLFPRTSRFRLD